MFAQLTVDGKWEGPHVFVVRIRDNSSQLTPGVRILDNGPKMGLNGVDNGQIWFDHVKVPRDALLDKYASVSAEGVYSSSIKSVGQRFGVTVGGLTTGDLPYVTPCSVVCSSEEICFLSCSAMWGVECDLYFPMFRACGMLSACLRNDKKVCLRNDKN